MSLKEIPKDIIDVDTFEQILEMDDDEEEREFSRAIVEEFFTQAEDTFKEMDKKLYELLNPFNLPRVLTSFYVSKSKQKSRRIIIIGSLS